MEHMPDHQHRRRSCRSTEPAAWIRARTRPDVVDAWQVIQRRRSGLLRYARGRGTVALPVLYAARDRRIYVRLPAYNDACNFVDRADVALDVDASTVGRVLIARATGLGLVVPDAGLPADIDDQLETWPNDLPTRMLVLVAESVHRIPAADDVRYPPLPQIGARLPGTYANL